MTSTTLTFTEFRDLLPETAILEPEHYQRARKVSHSVTGEAYQWQAYINTLALEGFEQWLRERIPEFPLQEENCSLLNPYYADVIQAACNLQVGEFKICVWGTESILNEAVSIPIAAIELHEFAAHFYVAVEVLEEQEEVLIRGFLAADQLARYRQRMDLSPQSDWTHLLPLEWFDKEVNHLLTELKYLSPSSIPLTVDASEAPAITSLTPSAIDTLLSDLPSPQVKLWQHLTWEQGGQLLRCPAFVKALYQYQTQTPPAPSLGIRLRELANLFSQPAIDTAAWLQGELDTLAVSLGLFQAQASLMRSIDRFEGAIADLREGGIPIPIPANSTYQDFDLNGLPLRLCAISWSIKSTSASNKGWSLLVILGTQLGDPLPTGMKLQVSNLADILEAPRLEFEEFFLYAVVEGSWKEKLIVTIIPETGSSVTLPPYTFAPAGNQ